MDPAPVRWNHGTLAVKENWRRLAMDTITHYGGKLYLTMVDCGPGRFAVWRSIASDSSESICRVRAGVFGAWPTGGNFAGQ